MRPLKRYLSTVVIVVSIVTLVLFHEKYDFSDKSIGKEVTVTISNGATGREIALALEQNGVIKSGAAFIDFYNSNSAPKSIAPGSHLVNTRISMRTAVKQLLDQKRIVNSVNVKEGSTFSDVLKLLQGNDHIIKEPLRISKLEIPIANAMNSLEGQLLPAIYSFPPGTSTSYAILQMLHNFKGNLGKNSLRAYGKYSEYQVLTIASLIQVEGDLQDYAKVASVIYNRLKIGMPLQLNSTVQYAANLRGRIVLSRKSTAINSPYNTYKVTGLPPTPICNPSQAAITSALNPEKTDYLYFITIKPGETRFTKSYEEFSTWTAEYNNNVAKGLFK